MKNNYERLLWGSVIIAAGILFALNVAGLIAFNIWEYIWPLFLTVLGVSILFGDKKNLGGWFFVVLGAVVFSRRFFDDKFDLRFIIAAVIILIGIFIIFATFKPKDGYTEIKGKQSQFVLFGGREDRIVNSDYTGTNTLCLFGGHEIDLRQLIFTHDIEITATAVFGGITLFLPQNVNIRIKSLPIFGGTENSTQNTENNPYTVFIKAVAVFGGVEIRN